MISRIRSYLFPHISRIFSAVVDSTVFRCVTFVLCMAFVAVNIWGYTISQEEAEARINLLSSPFSIQQHMQFGSYLFSLGNKETAAYELALAQQLYTKTSPAILGAQIAPMDLQRQWNTESDRLNSQYAFWSHIVAIKPDYRDAYLTLAALSHALHKNEETTMYLRQAASLDPNNTATGLLGSTLGVTF